MKGGKIPGQEIAFSCIPPPSTFKVDIGQPFIQQFVAGFELSNLQGALVVFVVADSEDYELRVFGSVPDDSAHDFGQACLHQMMGNRAH